MQLRPQFKANYDVPPKAKKIASALAGYFRHKLELKDAGLLRPNDRVLCRKGWFGIKK